MKKVLIVVENLPLPFDKRVWQEAKSLQEAGYSVFAICPKMGSFTEKYELIDGVHIYRHPLVEAKTKLGYPGEYLMALFWQTFLAWKIYLKQRFHIIHACNPPDTIFLVALPFKILGCKFVFDHHDLCPELFLTKFGTRGLGFRILLFLEKMTFKLADISIATNESYRDIAISRGGMKSKRVHVVRSGPSLSRLRIQPGTEAHKMGKRYLIGYIGVIGEQEGIDHLLQAVRYLVNDVGRVDFQVAIIGSGPALDSMKVLADQMDLSDRVTFYGRVEESVLLDILNTADVCVNPDVGTEMNDKSTMNKIMEYMCLGKPVVQYDLTEGRFSAGDASLYAIVDDPVDFAKKINRLLDEPALRKSMGLSGRKRIEQELSWEHEQPKLLKAYESL